MADNEITGLVLTEKSIEWTTVRRSKEGIRVVGSGKVDLTPAAKEPDAAAEPAADQTAEESLESKLRKELAAVKGDIGRPDAAGAGYGGDKSVEYRAELPALAEDPVAETMPEGPPRSSSDSDRSGSRRGSLEARQAAPSSGWSRQSLCRVQGADRSAAPRIR